jgi:hypothetical protein
VGTFRILTFPGEPEERTDMTVEEAIEGFKIDNVSIYSN